MSRMANLKNSLCSYFKTPIHDNFSLKKIILSVFPEISIGKRLCFSKFELEEIKNQNPPQLNVFDEL